jgi:hypothetical protein
VKARTEKLLVPTALLDDLDQPGLQLFDGGHVLGQDTHFTGFGGNVDLHTLKVKVSSWIPEVHGALGTEGFS